MVTPQAVATLNDIGTSWKEITNIENNVIDNSTSNDVNYMCTRSTVGISWDNITNIENAVNNCETKTTPSDSPMPDKPLFSGLLIHSFSKSKQLVRYNRSKYDTKWCIRVFI